MDARTVIIRDMEIRKPDPAEERVVSRLPEVLRWADRSDLLGHQPSAAHSLDACQHDQQDNDSNESAEKKLSTHAGLAVRRARSARCVIGGILRTRRSRAM
jgi:hypothetical protein